MTKDELLALADKVEALEGPSREVDCWIENRLGLARFVPDRPSPFGEGWLDKRVEPRPYTASLDAAMTLVPEGWVLRLSQIRFGMWQVELWQGDKSFKTDPDVRSIAATPALALTAASLRALAQKEQQP